ncbi:MAG: hypothetical protein KGK03_08235 [Candidatus Omnitrophica bacterium]|nr:hypothetical protein [Candidatus Omnitrophota bacterium]
MNTMLLGVLSMSNFVVALFFYKFWKNTRDSFFLLFAAAFSIETIGYIGQALTHSSLEDFPTFYLLRLFSFVLILYAIIRKNKPASS